MKKWAYYNEIDPFCCEWIKNLMREGLIADGEIDTRPIQEVQPEDVSGFVRCHWFAGIAGWDLALRYAGWDDARPVWTGSCPCQPFSAAGKGKGTADERHLWPEFYRLIRECRPAIAFGEQVASAAGRSWLSGVFADLESVGYAVGGADLCAAGIGAPHIRQRLWWVAYAKRDEQSRREPCHGSAGRVGRQQQPIPWNRDWQSALREFRAVDDGLSYGVASTDAARNAIVPQVAAEFIGAVMEAA